MKRVNIALFLGLLLFCQSFITVDSNRITWSPSVRIDWEDFKGQPDFGDGFRDVVTASSIHYTTICNYDQTMDVVVKADFIKDQSWVKPVARTDYHLGHERLHFDITELYVRKLRAEFANKKFTCKNQAEINGLAQAVMLEWRTTQNRYDKDSYYSLNKTAQADWEARIARELILFEGFSSK